MAAYQGTYYSAYFTIADDDDVAITITTWEFKAQFRASVGSEDVLVELTTANGGFTVIDGANGRLQLALTSAQTLLLPVGKVVFDIHRTDSAPVPKWLCRGTLKVKQSVTRDE